MNTILKSLGEASEQARPLPLPDELPEVMPFPVEALPDAFRPWCMDVAERMQCPIDFVAVPTLVAAASLAARHVAIRPQARTDWTERANLWALIVGRPGVMKSPALQQALAPIHRMENDARARFDLETAEFLNKALGAELQKEVALAEAKKKLRKNPAADIGKIPTGKPNEAAPTCERFIVNNVTYEQLGVILSENPGGTLAIRDEMKSMLVDLSKEERANARGFYVQAWSGGSYTFDRVGRGHIHIEDARLSMVGGIQPGPFGELVCQSQIGGAADGLIERFLIAWPDDPGQWRDVDRWPDSKAKQATIDAFDALAFLTPENVSAERDATREGTLYGTHYLRFDAAAHEAFLEWRADLEKKLRASESDGIESALAKYRHHVPALALTLHLTDDGVGPVSEVATTRALVLAEYFESHTRRCYSSSRQSTVRAAKAILRRSRKGDLPPCFTARDVYQKGWSRLTDKRLVADALDMLAAHHRLTESEIQTGGRPKVLYAIAGGAA